MKPSGPEYKPAHVVFDLDDPIDFGVDIAMTDALGRAKALELYRRVLDERDELGVSPVLVTPDAFHESYCDVYKSREEFDEIRDRLAATRVPDVFVEERMLEWRGRYEAALDRLAEACGGDPLAILHRVDGDTLGEIDCGDQNEIDPDALAPEDVRVAYRDVVARNEAARAAAKGLYFSEVVHSYDMDTALEQIKFERAHVVVVPGDASNAFAYLGFGACNDCPRPDVHTIAWQHWATTIGAKPVLIDTATVRGFATPIASREALVRFACEASIYDADLLQDDGYLSLLGLVFRNANLRFWWD
jgi:hypothetical protein